MVRQLEPDVVISTDDKPVSFWRNPARWLRQQKLSSGFWVFFTAALFFDFGFSIYVFMFNLYLLDVHFNERTIGLAGGAVTLGSVVGTLPAGFLARRFGLRPLLIACFVLSPVLGAIRVVPMRESTTIGLSFFFGLAMCLWAVCFLPAVAGVSSEEDRASAFSLIFSAGVGTSVLGGVACGYLPKWLSRMGLVMQPAEVKRLILLVSCGMAATGLLAMLRMRLPLQDRQGASGKQFQDRTSQRWSLQPFLLRFLPTMALWTVVLTSFTPFANVYLSRELHVPMLRIGLIFSAAQIVQVSVTLLTPLLFRKAGLVNGIVITQLLTAVALGCLAGTQNTRLAVALYLIFFGMQWMSAPGLYNLLMSEVLENTRSTASAMTMFCNALVGAGATAAAGILFTKFGYPHVLAGIAAVAVVAAMLFWSWVGPVGRHVIAPPQGAVPVFPFDENEV